jgi:hypothetical protein
MDHQYRDIEEHHHPCGTLSVIDELGYNADVMGRRKEEPDKREEANQRTQPVKNVMHHKMLCHARKAP